MEYFSKPLKFPVFLSPGEKNKKWEVGKIGSFGNFLQESIRFQNSNPFCRLRGFMLNKARGQSAGLPR